MGYFFAFQVLGYLCWRCKKPWNTILPEYDAYLEEYVYEKIWSELSAKDKEISSAMCQNTVNKVEEIRKKPGIPSNSFTVYRTRLLKKESSKHLGMAIFHLHCPDSESLYKDKWILKKIRTEPFNFSDDELIVIIDKCIKNDITFNDYMESE